LCQNSIMKKDFARNPARAGIWQTGPSNTNSIEKTDLINKHLTFLKMKKHLHFLLALLFMGTSIFAQETIVEWTFPDDSADSIADGGIEVNLDKGIYTMGGTSNLDYKNGFETKAAQATNWDNGTELKCWVIEFNTENYGDLLLSSKLSSGGNDPGPRDFRADYKIGDEGTWTEVPNSAIITANDWETGVLDGLPLPGECTNQSSVYLRWIMTSDTSSAGTLVEQGGKIKIDDIIITGTDVSGVEDADWNKINIFPNPFAETITIQNINEEYHCQIIDMTGRMVHSSNIANGQQLNLSQLNSGIYNLQLFDEKGNFVISKKIIKK